MSILSKEGSVLDRPGSAGISVDIDVLLERIRNDLHEPQRAFFDDNSTEILGLSAGYGAGKTRALCAACV